MWVWAAAAAAANTKEERESARERERVSGQRKMFKMCSEVQHRENAHCTGNSVIHIREYVCIVHIICHWIVQWLVIWNHFNPLILYTHMLTLDKTWSHLDPVLVPDHTHFRTSACPFIRFVCSLSTYLPTEKLIILIFIWINVCVCVSICMRFSLTMYTQDIITIFLLIYVYGYILHAVPLRYGLCECTRARMHMPFVYRYLKRVKSANFIIIIITTDC